AMDRHVIANMGAELGATTTVFPADERVRELLTAEDRADDFTELLADDGAAYDVTDQIDLSKLVPLIARPGSPGDVVPVDQVAGTPVHQVVVGSSANPGLRDFAMVAAILADRQAHPQVSLDVNPSSRQILTDLTAMGATTSLIQAGARLHQTGCLGCIGMGQAPAVGDDISTDEILQAGAEALPHRSNIAKLAEFTFRRVDQKYLDRVRANDGAHAVVAGRNYGQGSSREHAVLAPRSLGLRLVLARSYARIHWQNLVNFGVLPLEYDDVPGEVGDRLVVRDLAARLRAGADFTVA